VGDPLLRRLRFVVATGGGAAGRCPAGGAAGIGGGFTAEPLLPEAGMAIVGWAFCCVVLVEAAVGAGRAGGGGGGTREAEGGRCVSVIDAVGRKSRENKPAGLRERRIAAQHHPVTGQIDAAMSHPISSLYTRFSSKTSSRRSSARIKQRRYGSRSTARSS